MRRTITVQIMADVAPLKAAIERTIRTLLRRENRAPRLWYADYEEAE